MRQLCAIRESDTDSLRELALRGQREGVRPNTKAYAMFLMICILNATCLFAVLAR